MSVSLRDVLTVAGVAAVLFFTNLGGYPLFDEDEPKNAVCGREMFERGDWIVPTFNDELRTDKPILIYWLMLCSFNVFGVSEFAARFGSSLLSVGTALGVYVIGRKLYDRQVGLLAGVVVATCLMFSAVGRAVTPDATLVCCLTWVFCGFVLSRDWRGQTSSGVSQEPERPHVWRFAARDWLFPYAMMGLAMLAKGPVGFLLPCTALGLYGLCSSTRDDLTAGRKTLTGAWWRQTVQLALLIASPTRFLRTLWGMKLWIGIPVAFGIALPWYIIVGWKTDGAWLAGFLGGHNVGRFLQPMEQHHGPIIYYIPVLFAGTFPWSVFLPAAVAQLWKRVKSRAEFSESDLFLACWAATWLVFFSIARTKLPNYILPIYPAVAVIIARSLVSWTCDDSQTARVFLLESRMLSAIGAAIIIGLLIAMTILMPRERFLALVGVIPIVTGGVAYWFAQQDRRQAAVRSLAGGAAALCLCMIAAAPSRLANYQDSPYFANAARSATPEGTAEIASFEVFEPSLVYYLGHRVHRPNQPADIAQFFSDHPQGFLLIPANKLDRLPEDLAAQLSEVTRQRRFLRRYDLVLLGQGSQLAARQETVR
ncbi:MAG: glycosyltransferase family 39 protein [Planctomycetaceae bacterium]